ncbi:unnamed protein product [Porites lobata]|uniref:Uncharacterized protein n=1 Tax=Porites lobata TaxID=104759 RepID=A0ABN8P4Q3_9CNID|nr:unnamed protein product [Porites lobata]
MLLAACYVGFFGVLTGGEFTVNSPFDPSLHLSLANIQVDAHLNPQRVGVFIKCSKTDCESLCLLHLPWSWFRPLFAVDGTPLFRSKLSAFLKSTLKSAGVPRNFSGHIFRSGAATTTASQGIPDHLIKTMGRWSSEVYSLYVWTAEDTILSNFIQAYMYLCLIDLWDSSGLNLGAVPRMGC